MNREIKFRAWIKDEEKMFYPNERNYYMRVDGGLFRIVKLSDKKGQNFLSIETEAIIMQYTGLRDKNGKEIYEGDILTVWIEGCEQEPKYEVEDLRDLYFEMNRDDNYYRIQKSEIIGNIYENPELLK